jgi:hypothetical protein
MTRIHPRLSGLRILAATEMEELAKGMGLPSGLFEALRQGHDVGHFVTQLDVVPDDTGLLSTQTGHHGAAARIAYGILHIGVLKGGATRSEAIQMRGLHDLLREGAAEVAQVIGHDEQDIGLTREGAPKGTES